MRTWQDEWSCARLSLRLRDEQLFQCETVDLQVCAETRIPSYRSKALEGNQEPQTAAQVLQRWQEHFEGARVHIRIEEVSGTDQNLTSRSVSCLSTLLRQETRVSHVVEGSSGSSHGVVVVLLQAQFDLEVCHEFWDRSLLLVLHITPNEGVFQADQGNSDDVATGVGARESFWRPLLLRDEWASSHLLSLTREQAQPTLLMTRRIEQHIVVTKPLRLVLESRELAGQRIGILARVSNTHLTLAVAVRDLRLHLDQSSRAQNKDMSRFRIVNGDKASNPVVLEPQERYNFLFVLEPAKTLILNESLRLDEDNRATSNASVLRKEVMSPVLHVSTSSAPQRTSLTLSWKAMTCTMDAVTETCTIDWFPKAPSEPYASPSSGKDELDMCIRKLMPPLVGGHLQRGKKFHDDFKRERLLPNSVLQMTVAPLASNVLIGNAVTASVVVVNRSTRTEFDLTLLHPSQYMGITDGENNCTTPVVVGFEGCQRLGLVRPGMSVERRLRIVFLRLGKCKLGPLVLADHFTRTCFVSDDWNVFVKD
ncbi:unnamed protein product [Hyaloperonospora brassicae]|uniref:Uncharacterized protein n=1 Tax=Hyaloperonospora brassicae TaxID=162125 RepID=A0AAV0T6A4_HYABA|nr:unnamed protein product [Hyaloperonospora brassicae]